MEWLNNGGSQITPDVNCVVHTCWQNKNTGGGCSFRLCINSSGCGWDEP